MFLNEDSLIGHLRMKINRPINSCYVTDNVEN